MYHLRITNTISHTLSYKPPWVLPCTSVHGWPCPFQNGSEPTAEKYSRAGAATTQLFSVLELYKLSPTPPPFHHLCWVKVNKHLTQPSVSGLTSTPSCRSFLPTAEGACLARQAVPASCLAALPCHPRDLSGDPVGKVISAPAGWAGPQRRQKI